MKPFERLLAEAQTIVKEISKHPEFAEMFYLGLLNNSNVSICKFWTCLEELNNAHQAMVETQKQNISVPESEETKMQLNKIYDSTLLSKAAVYQIDGCSYHFLGKDPYSSIKSPKYRFKPLPGQKKQSELALNHKQLMIRCYEVTGMAVKTQTESVQSVKTVQLELF